MTATTLEQQVEQEATHTEKKREEAQQKLREALAALRRLRRNGPVLCPTNAVRPSWYKAIGEVPYNYTRELMYLLHWYLIMEKEKPFMITTAHKEDPYTELLVNEIRYSLRTVSIDVLNPNAIERLTIFNDWQMGLEIDNDPI